MPYISKISDVKYKEIIVDQFNQLAENPNISTSSNVTSSIKRLNKQLDNKAQNFNTAKLKARN